MAVIKFQYNFCYCSIIHDMEDYKSVKAFQYNFCYCSIISRSMVDGIYLMFQYNFCYCSIVQLHRLTYREDCFNTTFVTVLYCKRLWSVWGKIVSIQLLLLFYKFNSVKSYRRIYVSIQLLLLFYLLVSKSTTFSIWVSIQLLLLFYLMTHIWLLPTRCFNTTFVTVLLL